MPVQRRQRIGSAAVLKQRQSEIVGILSRLRSQIQRGSEVSERLVATPLPLKKDGIPAMGGRISRAGGHGAFQV